MRSFVSQPVTVGYCTINVSGMVCVGEPEVEVAVTLKVYVPAGVPFALPCGPLLELPPMPPPPPQDASNIDNASGTSQR